ncbi:MAG: hypothetical protein ABI651_13675 [Verrucomicrobiota bacterium]
MQKFIHFCGGMSPVHVRRDAFAGAIGGWMVVGKLLPSEADIEATGDLIRAGFVPKIYPF